MNEIIIGVNWLAIVVAAVVSFALGWLWYSPKLFGTRWMEGVGVSFNEAEGYSIPAMIAQAIGIFLFAWAGGVAMTGNGLLIFVLFVLALAFLMAAGGKFSQKRNDAIAIEVGYVISIAVVVVACQLIF